MRIDYRLTLLCIATITALAAFGSFGLGAGPYTAIAISPDSTHVLLGSQSGIDVLTLPELKVAGKIETSLSHVHDLRFSPNGVVLLAAGGVPAEEGSVEIIDWPSRQVTKSISLHQDLIYRVAWSVDNLQWATAGADGMCKIVDSKSCETVSIYRGHSNSVTGIEFLSDGSSVASVSVDQTLQVWDRRNGTRVRSLDNHVGPINGLAVRPNALSAKPQSAMVATISEDHSVRLWQPSIGRLMRFVKLSSVPRVVAWSSDGERLWVGCNDGVLRLLDAESLREIGRHSGGVGRIYELAPVGPAETVIVAGVDGVSCLDFGTTTSR